MNYEYFVGKVCTIFTVPIHRDFKAENPNHYPQQVFDYFMGVVEAIDQHAIYITRLQGGVKTMFLLHQVVGIAEEEVLEEGTKEHEELKSQLKAIPQVLENDTDDFINPAEMAKLSEQLLKKPS